MKQKKRYWNQKLIVLLVLLLALCFTACSGETATEPEIPYIEVTVTDELFEDKFYYGLLGEEEQLIYKEIYQGVINHQEEIYIHGDDLERQFEILDYILYDFPELFWIDGTVKSTSYEGGYSIIEPTLVYSKEERAQREAEIEAVTSTILSQIPAEYSEYEKIKFVYEYLVNTIDYVDDAPDNQNIYSAFVNKQTVCAGYARANQYLLNAMDVYCTYVLGTTTESTEESGGHAWNIVKCGENYYIVDVTWADQKNEEDMSQVENVMIYDYLCCSQETIANTHFEDEEYPYPECVSNDLEYYRMNGMYYENVDEEMMLQVMKDAIDARAEYTVFKFANAELLEKAKEKLAGDLMQDVTNYYCKVFGLKEMCYYTQEHDMYNRFTIYWVYQQIGYMNSLYTLTFRTISSKILSIMECINIQFMYIHVNKDLKEK